MSTVTFASLLRRNDRFRWLWSGQIVSEMGNWFTFIAELGLARALSGTAWAATGIAIAHLLPFCLLGPLAGAVADRFSRRALMIFADLARAVLALGFLAVTTPEHLPIAYACAAGLAAFSAFFEAAKNASLPNLARGDELLPATALIHATRFLQMTIGAALGGVATDAFGYRVAFAINAVSFVVSALCIARIPEEALRGAPAPPGERAPRSARVLARDVREAVRYVRANALVTGIIGLNVGWALGGGMISVIHDRFGGVVFATAHRSGDRGVAILYTAAGAGLLLGMICARRVGLWASERERVGTFIGWSTILAGALFAAGGLMPTIWLMAVFILLNRIVLSTEYALQETMLMNVLPDAMRGKVFTIDRSLEVLMMSLSAIVGGILFSHLPPRAVPVLAGLVMIAPGVAWLVAIARGRLQVPRAALGARPGGD